ncbi:cell wall protein DAN4-like, partial [Teratosphaeria destructans]
MAPSRKAGLAVLSACLTFVASTTTGVAGYIAKGLGQTQKFLPVSNSSSSENLTTVTSPYFVNGSSTVTAIPVITGSGLDYASSCLASSQSFWSARAAFESSEQNVIGTIPTPEISPFLVTATQYNVETCSGVTRLTTLCDGHPRVVGDASCSAGVEGYTASGTTTYWEVPIPSSYPGTMTSCSVEPADCQELYTLSPSLVFNSTDYLSWCSFTPSPTTTYATNSLGSPCQNCAIRANSARLLYWPVRTPSVSGPDHLCATTPVNVIGGTRTGSGPNTFVTDGVTITSPSVAISLADVSRADGCFQTISSTIIVVPSNELSSARGARALYTWAPFDYQDLNYRCQRPDSDQYIVQDEPGPDCYQEVPATAYFAARMAFDDWGENLPLSISQGFTIAPDYHPQVLPPPAWTAWANKLYNTTDCLIQPDGVWDPPVALTIATSEIGVTVPEAHSTTASSDGARTTSTAVPAEPLLAPPPQTSPSPNAPTSPAPASQQEPQSNLEHPTTDPGTQSSPVTTILTVFTLNAHLWTQISSDPSRVILASADDTTTFLLPGSNPPAGTETTLTYASPPPPPPPPPPSPGTDGPSRTTETVLTFDSRTWTQISASASLVVLAAGESTTVVSA